MIKLNVKKSIYGILMLAIGAVMFVGINGCKKEKEDDATAAGGGGAGAGGANSDYFVLDGTTFKFVSPTIGVQSTNSVGDPMLVWKSSNRTDTVATVVAQVERKEGSRDLSKLTEDITLDVKGIAVKVVSGDLKYTKEDGKWVITLTNGVGERYIGTGAPIKHTNLSMKMTWPN